MKQFVFLFYLIDISEFIHKKNPPSFENNKNTLRHIQQIKALISKSENRLDTTKQKCKM